jgi:hypothetical protein
VTATRNGTRQQPSDILARTTARVAAAKATRRLIVVLDAAEQDTEERFAHLAESRYWADAVVALVAYDRMFEVNP